MHKASMLIVPFVIVLALLISGCKLGKSKPKAAAKEGTAVVVALVEQRDITETIEVTGTLQPIDEVSVGTRAAGKISWLIGRGQPGTRVTRGKEVAKLDATDADIQLRAVAAGLAAANARLEQTKAAAVQQKSATDAGIANARAAVQAAEARWQQAKTSSGALLATTQAQIKSAAQVLSAAKSRYDALKNGSRDQERQIAQNNVNLSRAQLDLNQTNFDRNQLLFDKGAIARSQLDAAAATLQVSKMQFDSAQQQLALVQQGPRQEELDAADAQVKQAAAGLDAANAGLEQVKVAEDNIEIARIGVTQAKAALQSAESALNIDVMRDKDVLAAAAAVQQAQQARQTALEARKNTIIISPVDGVIAQCFAEVGQSIGANAAVLRLTTNSALYFEAKISELQAPRLRVGQPVQLHIDALEKGQGDIYAGGSATQTMVGRVERVIPIVDARTRNFSVRIIVNDTPALFPGMFARGQVELAEHPRVTAVPRKAVLERNGKQILYVVADGKARECPVTLGVNDSAYIQVLSGVLVGDQVITVGQQSLITGDSVTVRNEDATQ